VHSHDSNCIYSIAKSNGDSIEFSLSIAEQRAVSFIPAWSLAFLQPITQEPAELSLCVKYGAEQERSRPELSGITPE